MHPRYFIINKHEGETPLLALSRARTERGIDATIPLTYAGRLDPMAKGKLLVLVGDECKQQRNYHGLDKEYRFEILFGFSSDTGDILGMPERTPLTPQIDERRIADAIGSMCGPITLPYPVFSSKTVRGKPLFMWALEGRLDEIELPIAHTTIHSIRHDSTRTIAYHDLLTDIQRRIALPAPVTEESKRLGEDFRRKDITPLWEQLLATPGEATIASFRTVVSSGTYIRSLAPHIAKRLSTSGLAYSIERTKIGTYLPLPLRYGMWLKRF